MILLVSDLHAIPCQLDLEWSSKNSGITNVNLASPKVIDNYSISFTGMPSVGILTLFVLWRGGDRAENGNSIYSRNT